MELVATCRFCGGEVKTMLAQWFNGRALCTNCFRRILERAKTESWLCYSCNESQPLITQKHNYNNKDLCPDCFSKVGALEEAIEEDKLHPPKIEKPKITWASLGWKCPVCGTGNSPTSPSCPCVKGV